MPPGAFNRLADNWRPLLAIAQIAGGDWPARALAAFNLLRTPDSLSRQSTATADGPTLDFGHKTLDCGLLSAIRQIFTQSGRTQMSSQELVAALAALHPLSSEVLLTKEDQPSTPKLSTHQFARLLAPFGITPRTLRIDGRCPRGYLLTDFAKASAQFLDDGPKNKTPKG